MHRAVGRIALRYRPFSGAVAGREGAVQYPNMQTSLADQIHTLARARHAIILAHNYQLDEVQALADYTGDSLELSRKVRDVEAAVIVFCGVRFMAETAALLNPERTVLLPDAHAGCPMADMIDAAQVRVLKAQHPGAQVVCYVNSTAEVKAESDICCTSANAVEVVQSLDPAVPVIFVPDQHLGHFVQERTRREMIIWPGFCPTHAHIQAADIAAARATHPGAEVLAHPECNAAVRATADQLLSTGQMCRYAQRAATRMFIIATEIGILYRLRTENPGKQFFPSTECARSPNMKKITLEKILWSLQRLEPVVAITNAQLRERAVRSIERMLDVVA